MTSPFQPGGPRRGRGAVSNRGGRYESFEREPFDDGWDSFAAYAEEAGRLKTELTAEKTRSIISTNDSPDIPFDQSINPYKGCEHGCPYCLGGDTKILMANGRVRSLAELEVGDAIVGTERRGHYRRYVQTRVLAHWQTRKPAYRITLGDGTELVASGDHRFLTERGWKFVRVARRSRLTSNNKLMGVGDVFAEPAGEPANYVLGYLTGMIRGDGSIGSYEYPRYRAGTIVHRFRLALADSEGLDRTRRFLARAGITTRRFQFQQAATDRRAMQAIRTAKEASVRRIRDLVAWPVIPSNEWARGFLAGIFDAEGSASGGIVRISNTDPAIIAETTRALALFGFDAVREIRRRANGLDIENIRVRGGAREHLRFFTLVDPAIRRKCSIVGQALKSAADLRVVSVEPLGAMPLFDITTGTGDFIANGVVSHNCFARPTHAYLGLSPGQDFESRIVYKPDAAEVLRRQLGRKSYQVKVIAIGANTDPYQPAEREKKITRQLIEVMAEHRHPFAIVTKSAGILRDLDLLGPLARDGLFHAFLSITTLTPKLARAMEPRAAAPRRRLEAVAQLAGAGVPVGVLASPMIPALNDHELESILEAARDAGAASARYLLVRLPLEIKDLFREWLEHNVPDRAARVLKLIRETRDGALYDSRFGVRMRGTGTYADLLARRYQVAARRLGLDGPLPALDDSQFVQPPRSGQLPLF